MANDARKNGSKAPRILIVDDDPGQRSLLDSFLHSQGFETVVATSGEQALEKLRSQEFGMMISDVRMPGMSGLETLRRARQEHSVLPVLMVTLPETVTACVLSVIRNIAPLAKVIEPTAVT